MDTEFTPMLGFLGGGLIGLSAVLLMGGLGRIAGISGIFSGLLSGDVFFRTSEIGWKISFIFGILIGAIIISNYSQTELSFLSNLPLLVISGILVGAGTQLGSGCTSGHGVCGLARLSWRSLAATVAFMSTAICAVFFTRHILIGI